MPGDRRPGTALRTILASAELLRVSACAVVSPESTTIEPEWIERLLRPVYQGNYDFVTPLYRRHKFDGLLMRNLVYPMTRAFYGKQVREPYAAEFSFSGQLASHFLSQEIWTHEVGQTGTEIALTISAITGGFRLAQSFLGVKPHADSRSADLVAAMRQTVGALFWSLEPNFPLWSAKNDSQPIPTLGRGRRSHAGTAAHQPQTSFRHVPLRRRRTGTRAEDRFFRRQPWPNCSGSPLSTKMIFFTEMNYGPAPSMNSPLRITRPSSAGTTSFRLWRLSIAEGHLRFWWKTARLQENKWSRTSKTFA